jgi:hypothetical protein
MHSLLHPHLRKDGTVASGAGHSGLIAPGEAFIPSGSPYLGQTILGEPLG